MTAYDNLKREMGSNDPFRAIKEGASNQDLKTLYNKEALNIINDRDPVGTYNPPRTDSRFKRGGKIETRGKNKQRAGYPAQTGVIPRARLSDYKSILEVGSEYTGKGEAPEAGISMFQAQNRQIANALLRRPGITTIMTQGITEEGRKDPVNFDILAPNSALKEIAARINDINSDGSRKVITTRKAGQNSLHPKVGWVSSGGVNDELYAFFGTQNWTAALEKNSTLETLLVLDAKAAERFMTANRPKKFHSDRDLASRIFKSKYKTFEKHFPAQEGEDRELHRRKVGRAFIEQSIGREVITLTQDLIKAGNTAERRNAFFSNVALAQLREKRQKAKGDGGLSQNFVLYNQEILQDFNNTLNTVEKKVREDSNANIGHVYISMNRIDALIGSSSKQGENEREYNSIKRNLMSLAEKGKLSIMTDRKSYNNLIENLAEGDEEVIKALSESGAIQLSPTMLHDKSMLITDKEEIPMYWAIQSANTTKHGMMTGDTTVEGKKVAGDDRNTEAMVRIKSGELLDNKRIGGHEKQAYQDYLDSLDLVNYYQSRMGKPRKSSKSDPLDSEKLGYSTLHRTEIAADSKGVNSFITKIEKLNEQYGEELIEVEKKYAPGEWYTDKLGRKRRRGYNEPIGIRVRIKSARQGKGSLEAKGLNIDLTVNEEGKVILSDLNKIVGDTLLINKSNKSVDLPGKTGKLAAGEDRQLDSQQSALGVLATMVSEVSYRHRYELPSSVYENLLLSNKFKAGEGLSKVVGDLLIQEITKLDPQNNSGLKGHASTGYYNLPEIVAATDPNLLTEARKRVLNYAATHDIDSGLEIKETNIINKRKTAIDNILYHVDKASNIYQKFLDQGEERAYTEVASYLTGNDLQGDYNITGMISATYNLRSDYYNTEGSVLEDFRTSVITRDRESLQQYYNSDRTLSHSIIQSVTEPFLADHDQERAQQAKPLPVYSVEQDRVNRSSSDLYNKTVELGILNPHALDHSERITTHVQRPLAAVSRKEQTEYGKQGRAIVVGDKNATAVKVVEMKSILEGVTGFGYSTLEKEVSDLEKLYKTMTGSEMPLELKERVEANKKNKYKTRFRDLEQESTGLYLMPYNKMEQITQRFKNVTGSRITKEVSSEIVEKLKSGEPLSENDIENLWIGNIRSNLSKRQWDILTDIERGYREAYGLSKNEKIPYSDMIKILRKADIDPLREDKGLVTVNKLKRYAATMGFSTIGDWSVASGKEGVEGEYVSKTKFTRLNFNLKSLESTDEIIGSLSKFMSKGTQIVGGTGDKAGMYVYEEKKGWVKAGVFTDTGQIQFTDESMRKISGRSAGPQKAEPITLSVGANEDGFEEAITLFTGDLTIDQRATGTLVASQQETTISRRHSGHRKTSGGGKLQKGPSLLVKHQLFENIKEVFNKRNTEITVSNQSVTDEVSQLVTLDQFKGFGYETGITLLADPLSREQLTNIKGKEEARGEDIAKSLGFLLSGNKEVKEALVKYYRSKELYSTANALENIKGGLDISQRNTSDPLREKRTSFDVIAQGLVGLNKPSEMSEDMVNGELIRLKSLVKQALSGEEAAKRILAERSKLLFETVTSDPELSKIYEGEEGANRTVLKEDSSMVKSAGVLAHLMYFNQQLFRGSINQMESVGGIYQQSIPTGDEFISYIEKIKEGKKLSKSEQRQVDFVKNISTHTLIPIKDTDKETDIRRKVNLLRSAQRNDMLLEFFSDSTPSSSMVSVGGRDEANFEFHYYLGMTKGHLDKYRTQEDKDSPIYKKIAGIQEAYTNLNAAVGGGYYTTTDEVRVRTLLDNPVYDPREHGYASLVEKEDKELQALKDKGVNDFIRIKQYYDNGAISYRDYKQRYGNIKREQRSSYKQIRAKYASYRNSLTNQELDFRILATNYASYVNTKKRNYYNTAIEKIIVNSPQYQSGRPEEVQEEFNNIESEINKRRKNRTERSDIHKDYIHGILTSYKKLHSYYNELERAIQSGEFTPEEVREYRLTQEETSRQINSLKTTQQVVIPHIKLNRVQSGENAGYYTANISSYDSDQTPSVGVLMGVDTLQNLSLVFGSHKDEAILTQFELIEKMAQARPILDKLNSTEQVILNDEEAKILEDLQKVAEKSSISLKEQVTNETMRKAHGEHEGFKGAVGYAMNSFALDPSEIVLGERFARINNYLNTHQLIDNSIEELVSIVPENYNLRNFNSQQEFEQQLKKDYDSAFNSIEAVLSPVNPERETPSNVVRKDGVYKELYDFLRDIKSDKSGNMTSQYISEDIKREYKEIYNTLGVKEAKSRAIRAYIYQRLLGTKNTDEKEAYRKELQDFLQLTLKEEENREKIEKYKKEISLKYGAQLRRSGSPASDYALMGDIDVDMSVLSPEQFGIRLEEQGSKLIPDDTKSSSLIMASSVSTAIAGLGDYDGDSFQVLLARASEAQNEVLRKQQEYKRAKDATIKARIAMAEHKVSLSESNISTIQTLNTETQIQLKALIDNLKKNDSIQESEYNSYINAINNVKEQNLRIEESINSIIINKENDPREEKKIIQDQARVREEYLRIASNEALQKEINKNPLFKNLQSIDKNLQLKAYLQAFNDLDSNREPSNLEVSQMLKVVKENIPKKSSSTITLDYNIQNLDKKEDALRKSQENLEEAQRAEEEIKAEYEKVLEDYKSKGVDLKEGYKKHTEAITSFVKNYTSLPEFAFEGLQTSQHVAYISQKYDASGVENATWIKEADRKVELFGRLLDENIQDKGKLEQLIKGYRESENKYSYARAILKEPSREELLSIYGDDREKALDRASGELTEILNIVDREEQKGKEINSLQILSDYYGKVGNYQQALEGITGSFRKLEGIALDPYEFDAVQSVVGEGGSKLIGDAYNTLIPLLERSMYEQGILKAIESSNQKEDIREGLSESTRAKVSSSEFKETTEKRYFSTLSTLTNFQQLVRDALKAKSGSALNVALTNTGYIDAQKRLDQLNQEYRGKQGIESLESEIEYLKIRISEGNNVSYLQDKVRNREKELEALKRDPDIQSERTLESIRRDINAKEVELQEQLYNAISTTVGMPVSTKESKVAEKFINNYSGAIEDKDNLFSSGKIYDTNLTAFGVLLDLSKFSKLGSESDVYKEFIEGQIGADKDTGGKETVDYVAEQISEAMLRAEAGFKAESIKDGGKEQFLERAKDWYAKNKDLDPKSKKESEYKKLIEAYQRVEKGLDEDGRKEAEKLLVRELILTNMREENKRTGAINAETIKMLRHQQQGANKLLDNDDEGLDSSISSTIAAQARQMMRGKTTSSEDAIQFTSWNLQAIDATLEQMGYSKEEIDQLDPQEKQKVQAKIAKLHPSGAFEGIGDLNSEDQKELISLISGLKDEENKVYSEMIKNSTEALSQVLKYTEQIKLQQSNEEEVELLSESIRHLTTEENKIDVSKYLELKRNQEKNESRNTEEEQNLYEQLVQEQQEDIRQRQQIERVINESHQEYVGRYYMPGSFDPSSSGGGIGGGNNNYPQKGGIPEDDSLVFRSSALEGDLFGAVGSLLAFNLLASDDKPKEERLPMLAYDSLQALAEIGASHSKGKRTWTGSLMGSMAEEVDFKYKQASIKQAMESQGLAAGAVQGLSQTLVQQGFSELSRSAVTKLLPRRKNVRGTTAIAGVTSEAISSLMSLSVARSITKQRTIGGRKPQDFISGFLINYVENVWKMVEEMQLALLNSNAEVLDTTYNQNLDFDATGFVSEFEWDLETGMIIVDSDSNPLASAFEEDSNNSRELSETVLSTANS